MNANPLVKRLALITALPVWTTVRPIVKLRLSVVQWDVWDTAWMHVNSLVRIVKRNVRMVVLLVHYARTPVLLLALCSVNGIVSPVLLARVQWAVAQSIRYPLVMAIYSHSRMWGVVNT